MSLPECDAVQFGRYLPMFRRNRLLPFLGPTLAVEAGRFFATSITSTDYRVLDPNRQQSS
jgi:hypothetical protein